MVKQNSASSSTRARGFQAESAFASKDRRTSSRSDGRIGIRTTCWAPAVCKIFDAITDKQLLVMAPKQKQWSICYLLLVPGRLLLGTGLHPAHCRLPTRQQPNSQDLATGIGGFETCCLNPTVKSSLQADGTAQVKLLVRGQAS